MEPCSKRARLSGEDVEDGPVSLSLFNLSLDAMIENAKNGVCPIEVHKLLPLVTERNRQNSSFLDVIENICILGTFELYSNRVIRPPKFTVRNWRMDLENSTKETDVISTSNSTMEELWSGLYP